MTLSKEIQDLQQRRTCRISGNELASPHKENDAIKKAFKPDAIFMHCNNGVFLSVLSLLKMMKRQI